MERPQPSPIIASTLTVIELDALPAFGVAGQHTTARAAIVQQPGETPSALAERVARRARGLEAGGYPLQTVVLVCDGESRPGTAARRTEVAQTVVAFLKSSRSRRDAARLVLDAPSWATAASRRELLTIAGSLTAQLEGEPVEISVRFTQRPDDQACPVAGAA